MQNHYKRPGQSTRVSDKIIKVTEKGLLVLEQYRVRKAIILAAGFGSRMLPATKDKPKPLVLVNNARIIDTLLDALIKAEINDIVIVTGYKGDRFNELLNNYPTIKLVNNPIFDKYILYQSCRQKNNHTNHFDRLLLWHHNIDTVLNQFLP